MGVGGSIPFIAEFLEAFPRRGVLVTGVEDPDTRAHGANEGLHLAEFERVCSPRRCCCTTSPRRARPRPLSHGEPAPRSTRRGLIRRGRGTAVDSSGARSPDAPRQLRPAGGDGLLTHELDPHDHGPQDACGVFGVWAPGEDVAKLTYFGLYALQHRGQESAGHRGQQRPADPGLQGHGPGLPGLRRVHARARSRATSRSATRATPRPARAPGRTPSRPSGPTDDGSIALGHNGNLTNTRELAADGRRAARRAGELELPVRSLETRDQRHRAWSPRCSRTTPTPSLEAARARGAARCCAAPSRFVWMDENTLYAARDPQGIRPLVLGRLERGWVVACETAALDIVGAVVRPRGRARRADRDRRERPALAARFAEPAPKGCLFEYVYLARPDTTITGRSVHSVRVEIGRRLAREFPVDADLVIPVPESGTPAAIGYAEESGIPYGTGPGQELLRRPHVHPAQPDHPPARHPAQAQPAARRDRGQAARGRRRLDRPRQHPARPGPDAARGRRPRGARADLLPPVKWPCFYGIDFATRAELIANGLDRRRDLPLDRRRLARLHLPRGAGRGDHRADGRTCAGPASTGSTRSSCPSRSTSASTCWSSLRRSARTSTGCRPRWPAVGAGDALERP